MKIAIVRVLFFLVCFFLFAGMVTARDAPITTAGSAEVCQGASFSIPVTVKDFTQIKAMTLRLDFDSALMTYTGFSNVNASLSGIAIGQVQVSPTLMKIVVVWFNVNALTLANGTKLFDLNFTLRSGSPSLSFNNTAGGGSECEYGDENAHAMNDLPTDLFYFNAAVNNLSVPAAGLITGPEQVCMGDTAQLYFTDSIPRATSYEWTIPPGAVITAGQGTKAITVDYPAGASSGPVQVYGMNGCGNGSSSPELEVIVHPIPPAPAISFANDTLYSASAEGNQWYRNNTMIAGATGAWFVPELTGYYISKVTLQGCSSDSSNSIYVLITAIGQSDGRKWTICPNPNNGVFNLVVSVPGQELFSLKAYNNVGIQIAERKNLLLYNAEALRLDIRPQPDGIYYLMLINEKKVFRQTVIIINSPP